MLACIIACGLAVVSVGNPQVIQTTSTPPNTLASRNTGTSVVTYHNDPQRTGWNSAEDTLTQANVTPSTFGLIAPPTLLDDQVDAQPLVVPSQPIEGEGVHTVVYVATENNTIYAIDAESGAILRSNHLETPVGAPFGCFLGGPNIGINSTPTIDVRKHTMYVVAYTLVGGTETYRLHALRLNTLSDRPGSPITISASHPLTNGSVYSFNAKYQRQRSALLQANGNIYAAFASFCDAYPQYSRGWLLGWHAETLAALPANELTDSRFDTMGVCDGGVNIFKGCLGPSDCPGATCRPYYLSSIWMSGYGAAADHAGNLFFVTGNSNPKENTYNGTTNIPESVVKIRGDLSGVLDLFTPSNAFSLDGVDLDYGSGGVLVLPDQSGPVPHLAVAAGKDGRLFSLNRDSMGGFNNPDIPWSVDIGNCWCGPSYYKGSDGVGRVVSSGGLQAKTWTVNTVSSPALQPEASATPLARSPQEDGGFFTSVSSNGTNPGTAVIWAIGRPAGNDNHITLYAFSGTASGGSLPLLWSGAAGTWPNLQGNANLVPTVANGRVYVASYRQLAIFGLRGPIPQRAAPLRREPILLKPPPPSGPKPSGALYWGTIKTVDGYRITIALRTGKLLDVDLGSAIKEGTTIDPVAGKNVVVNGKVNTKGVLEARTMWRAKAPGSWGADIPNR